MREPLIDLGAAPPSNRYLDDAALRQPEKWYPLRVLVCTECWLVQTEDFANREDLFSADYAYFSSYSTSWLEHAERFVASAVERFGLDGSARVIEVACNDGYLLQFVKARGIPCLGVEPTAGTAAAARRRGIEVVEEFFGAGLARHLAGEGIRADLAVANNVLAHVPDINDFATGFAHVLKPQGVATFEFPHFLNLLRQSQFDTVYHEHYSYLSLGTVSRIFGRCGLSIFDVEEIPTHGGSLRAYAQRADTGARPVSDAPARVRAAEVAAGLETLDAYAGFQARADRIKNDLLAFLIEAKRSGKVVAAYGAAAKGNTLLNYAGVRPDLIRFVVDRNPAKQGKYMPGSRIPIVGEERLRAERPDYVLILPWNLFREVSRQLEYARVWRATIVIAVPRLEIM